MDNNISGYKAPNLPDDKHLFCSNMGGVSCGKYSSLNVSLVCQDDVENIKSNIELIAKRFGLGIENVFLPLQSHTNKAIFVDNPSLREINADACVTNKKDILLLVTSADCIPVLLRDDVKGLVGAVHSGWRGTLDGVTQNTIDLMIEKGSKLENIKVAIGPNIAKKSFEAKQDLYDLFDDKSFFEKTGDGYLLDLEAYMIKKLKDKGIKNITTSGIDTYTSMDYFSFRRATHMNLIEVEKDFPIQASVIKL